MPYNQRMFEALPLTLSLKVFCAWSGLRKQDVLAMAAAGTIRQVAIGNGRRPRHRYFKKDLARLAGWEY